MTLTELQAQAQENMTRRSAAAKVANARLQAGDVFGYDALRYNLPNAYAEVGPVRVCVDVPQNRTVYRKPHRRFRYYVNGKSATEIQAQAALV